VLMKELIEKCLNADRAAQNLLYQHYRDHLMSICYRYCNSMHDAQDALQNTFIRIFTKLSSFSEDKGNFKSWSSSIAVRESIAILRAKKKVHFGDDSLSKVELIDQLDVIDQMTVEELRSIIENLREEERIIINLHFFDGYSHKEIGVMLGIKENSSRSRLFRAKLALREKWKLVNIISY